MTGHFHNDYIQKKIFVSLFSIRGREFEKSHKNSILETTLVSMSNMKIRVLQNKINYQH